MTPTTTATSRRDDGQTTSGPQHDGGCLAATVKEALCRCSRGGWLDEMVPRAQARAELLSQLATWAGEQGIFAEADLDRPEPDERNGRWRSASRRLGASLARDVFIGVRMTALSLRGECEKRPTPPPTEPVVETVATVGGVL